MCCLRPSLPSIFIRIFAEFFFGLYLVDLMQLEDAKFYTPGKILSTSAILLILSPAPFPYQSLAPPGSRNKLCTRDFHKTNTWGVTSSSWSFSLPFTINRSKRVAQFYPIENISMAFDRRHWPRCWHPTRVFCPACPTKMATPLR